MHGSGSPDPIAARAVPTRSSSSAKSRSSAVTVPSLSRADGAQAEGIFCLPRTTRALAVARWWGDPEERATLLEQDLDEPRMVMRVVAFRGRPFAYTQDYDVRAWPQPHLAHLPPGSRAVDALIGEPSMIGAGHG
jgi:aminoglycoside 6'-N-acetyltransferase